ncbi:MAG: hypothetical protein CR974_03280 [Gammaproteobacteria bacterium]|nr:MAG: hypothetical protein CR974_03280 [Gammaproteobacteria bacterium]
MSVNNQAIIHDAVTLDAVIIGGGIAGLFALAKLLRAGYRVVLLEQSALGNGQTLKSQGIIHGGTKYALRGKPTAAQRQIAHLPTFWRQCLAGEGEFDLSACRVLAEHHSLWAMPTLSSRVTGFFASKAMQSHVTVLTGSEKPNGLSHPDCCGRFYRLDEPVLDVRSLLDVFVAQYGRFILTDCEIEYNGHAVSARRGDQTWLFHADKRMVTAGQGNADFAEQQLRPLQMVYVRVPKTFGRVFVHVLAASDKPRLTITTHDSDRTDEYIWYLGGNLAEKGAALSADKTIALAEAELAAIFPWLDFSSLAFNTVVINRAEGIANGKRPDTPMISVNGDTLVAWPTKLAMAPMLADELLARLPPPQTKQTKSWPAFPPARVGHFPW